MSTLLIPFHAPATPLRRCSLDGRTRIDGGWGVDGDRQAAAVLKGWGASNGYAVTKGDGGAGSVFGQGLSATVEIEQRSSR